MNTSVHGLVDLPDAAPCGLERSVVRFRHRLTESGMFGDRNLVRVIDSHPRNFLDVSATRSVDFGPHETGSRTGARLLETVKRGEASIVIRNVMRFQPGLQRLVERLYAELDDRSPGFATRRHTASLVLSHPAAPVDGFLGETPGILWQVRGRQRVWVSPRASDSADYDAAVFELNAGDSLASPLSWPHRTECLDDGLNVSLSTGHYTPRQLRQARVDRANELLRSALKLPCRSTRTSGLTYAVKSTVYFGWRAVQRLRFARM
jgi:hypothetical protein